MRVFVTGASGWIGSAVVPELIGAGHQVVGLARSDASAAALTAAGAEVQRGTLDDLDVLRAVRLRASDGVIHLAFKHDLAFSGDFAGRRRRGPPRRRDVRRGARGFRPALRHRLRRPRARTGRRGDRAGRARSRRRLRLPWAVVRSTRRGTAQLTLALAARGVRSSVVRLPPTVSRRRATTASWRRWSPSPATRASAGYVGDGSNRWPAVHRLDAARAFRLALEKAPAGSALHAVADEGVADPRDRRGDRPPPGRPGGFRLPRGRGRALRVAGRFIVALDSPASSALTRELLGWQPTHPGLIDDLDEGHYFRAFAVR